MQLDIYVSRTEPDYYWNSLPPENSSKQSGINFRANG